MAHAASVQARRGRVLRGGRACNPDAASMSQAHAGNDSGCTGIYSTPVSYHARTNLASPPPAPPLRRKGTRLEAAPWMAKAAPRVPDPPLETRRWAGLALACPPCARGPVADAVRHSRRQSHVRQAQLPAEGVCGNAGGSWSRLRASVKTNGLKRRPGHRTCLPCWPAWSGRLLPCHCAAAPPGKDPRRSAVSAGVGRSLLASLL